MFIIIAEIRTHSSGEVLHPDYILFLILLKFTFERTNNKCVLKSYDFSKSSLRSVEVQCSRLIGDQLLFAVQVRFEVSGNFMLQMNTDQLLLAVQVKCEVSGNFMLQITRDQLLFAVQVKFEVSGNFMLQINRDQHFLAVQVKLRSVDTSCSR